MWFSAGLWAGGGAAVLARGTGNRIASDDDQVAVWLDSVTARLS